MRRRIECNHGWKFIREDAGLPERFPENWQDVTLPHTWNAVDGQDGKGEYYRGICWYAKSFQKPEGLKGHRLFVEVKASSLSGIVYVNGHEVVSHRGGFGLYRGDLTGWLKEGENLLVIQVDNRETGDVYPQMADFTFYGGLYRGVDLILVPERHFDLEFWGTKGLAVTPEVVEGGAKLHLNAWVKNGTENETIRYEILDGEGKTAAEAWRPALSPETTLFLPDAHLWQGVEDPYLYTCRAALVYRNETLDEVSERFGIRTFLVDPDKGFFLNGKPMKLRGVSRHQDRLYKGNALTKEDHLEDAALIKEIGANTVRLAHYQHSHDFYDACDEMGFVVWAEIPYISCQSDDPAAHENCRLQIQDLIHQNYHHASICFWGISNEITISGEKPGLVENHRELNALVKRLDPTRLTTIAHVSMLSQDSALHTITDVESYNHYFGWYGGEYTNNEAWLDGYHAKYPNRCIGLSEYGAEGILTYQNREPKCRDYSEAYQAKYHEHMARILMERDYLWSTYVWNMFDFGCAARDEGGVAGRNNKGLVTMDRKIKKDSFFIYQAWWSKEPFVHLCGKRYAIRSGESTQVKVYSNQPAVKLYVDGQLMEEKEGGKVFTFDIPLKKGLQFIMAVSGEQKDSMTIEGADREPEIYTLKEEAEEGDHGGVANWFNAAAAEAASGAMEFPEGYFSIKDTIKDIMEHPQGYEVLAKALTGLTGMRMKRGMMAMIGGKTVEEMVQMAEDMGMARKMPENAMGMINAQLTKIKKE